MEIICDKMGFPYRYDNGANDLRRRSRGRKSVPAAAGMTHLDPRQTRYMKYINAKSVRELALAFASGPRPRPRPHRSAQGFDRVSKQFLERIDAHVRNIVLAEVKSHPSIGKTLK